MIQSHSSPQSVCKYTMWPTKNLRLVFFSVCVSFTLNGPTSLAARVSVRLLERKQHHYVKGVWGHELSWEFYIKVALTCSFPSSPSVSHRLSTLSRWNLSPENRRLKLQLQPVIKGDNTDRSHQHLPRTHILIGHDNKILTTLSLNSGVWVPLGWMAKALTVPRRSSLIAPFWKVKSGVSLA